MASQMIMWISFFILEWEVVKVNRNRGLPVLGPFDHTLLYPAFDAPGKVLLTFGMIEKHLSLVVLLQGF